MELGLGTLADKVARKTSSRVNAGTVGTGMLLSYRGKEGLVEVAPADLDRPAGQQYVAYEFARPDPQVELHGTEFRLGDRFVGPDGGGRAHIKRTDCTLVCAPIDVNSGVIVEVAPKPEHRQDAPAGDAWLNPNRWPQLAAELMDPAARFAFTAAKIPTADAGEADGFAYLEIATNTTTKGDRHTRRVKLMRAAGWAKDPSKRPRDVRRDALGQKGDAESAGRYPLEFQSGLDVDDFLRHVGECSEALRAQASQGAAPKRGRESRRSSG